MLNTYLCRLVLRDGTRRDVHVLAATDWDALSAALDTVSEVPRRCSARRLESATC